MMDILVTLPLIAGCVQSSCAVAAVDLADDVEYSWGYLVDQVDIPLFECLCHDGVVGVGKGIGHDVPRLIPAVAAVIEQNAHQLRHSERRVGVVDVDGDLLVQVIERAVNAHVVVDDIADRCRAEEILLTQTERLALQMVVVRIEHLGDRICDGVLSERLGIVALVEHAHIEGRCSLPATDAARKRPRCRSRKHTYHRGLR